MARKGIDVGKERNACAAASALGRNKSHEIFAQPLSHVREQIFEIRRASAHARVRVYCVTSFPTKNHFYEDAANKFLSCDALTFDIEIYFSLPEEGRFDKAKKWGDIFGSKYILPF